MPLSQFICSCLMLVTIKGKSSKWTLFGGSERHVTLFGSIEKQKNVVVLIKPMAGNWSSALSSEFQVLRRLAKVQPNSLSFTCSWDYPFFLTAFWHMFA